ncbi:unnamed protein product [Vitrella brassicaformis CCMP3155]|uniref:Uncharacterized protein n=2 Tax=Vitrella brassicaformis TaxID=1169539 RepID=A0A0G4EY24_VITBC|nr:unnamed protein product [Vitrella brassicaformis CCMP3155]|eukprot:CEM04233.1 unnamed protein product [Vitrella brassicaformis CCMP3155]
MSIEESLCRTAKLLNIPLPGHNKDKTHPVVLRSLSQLHPILWTLQRQPLYMKVLSNAVVDSSNAAARGTFNRTADSLFRDLEDPFICFRYLSLAKMMAQAEISLLAERGRLASLFRPPDSLLLDALSGMALKLRKEITPDTEPKLRARLAIGRESFRDSMKGFMDPLRRMRLPRPLRILLFHIWESLESPSLESTQELPTVPCLRVSADRIGKGADADLLARKRHVENGRVLVDLSSLWPIAKLFFHGVLIPFMSAPATVSGIPSNREDAAFTFNCKQVCEFFCMVCEDSFDASQSIERLLADEVTVSVCEALLGELTDIQPTELDIGLTLSLYQDQLRHTPKIVTLMSSDVCGLINLLIQTAVDGRWQLRRETEDPLQRLVGQLRPIEPDVLHIAKKTDRFHNFTLSDISTYSDLSSSAEGADADDVELLRSYKDDDAHGVVGPLTNSIAALERGLAIMPPIRPMRDFALLKFEVEEAAARLLRSPSPNIYEATTLQEAIRELESIRGSDITSEDVMRAIERRIEARKRHAEYLLKLREAKASLTADVQLFEGQMGADKEFIKAYQDCLAFSDGGLEIEREILRKASEEAVMLKFPTLSNAVTRRPKLAAFLPKGANLQPSFTFPLGFLVSRGVVARLKSSAGGDHSLSLSYDNETRMQDMDTGQEQHGTGTARGDEQQMYRSLVFTFTKKAAGGYDVQVLHRSTSGERSICHFAIAFADIMSFKTTHKNAQVEYSDGFVVFNCYPLLRLLVSHVA